MSIERIRSLLAEAREAKGFAYQAILHEIRKWIKRTPIGDIIKLIRTLDNEIDLRTLWAAGLPYDAQIAVIKRLREIR